MTFEGRANNPNHVCLQNGPTSKKLKEDKLTLCFEVKFDKIYIFCISALLLMSNVLSKTVEEGKKRSKQ